MDVQKEACIRCKIKSKVVAILNEEELTKLGQGCLQTGFSKGELIFKESAPAMHIVYIRNGFVKLSKKGLGDKDYILSIAKNGAYLGINNLNKKGHPCNMSATALTSTEVCFIDIEIFGLLLKQNGDFASEVIRYIFDDEMNYFDRLVNNVQQQVPGRLANTLLYFRYQVYDQNPFQLNLTKLELASLIGTSRESITRILKEFQDSGIIRIDKNTCTILDKQRLNEIRMKG